MIFNITGGGKFAKITAYVPTNTAVTCSKSPFSFSKNSGSGTSVTFEVPVSGTWTVTATRNGLSDTKTVNASTQGQTYSVTMSLRYYLFKQGEGAKVQYSSSNDNYRIENGILILAYQSVSNRNDCATGVKIDLTNYRTLAAEAKDHISGGGGHLGFYYKDELPIYDSSTRIAYFDPTDTLTLYTADISGITGSWYLGLSYGSSFGCDIYNWYLEA